MGSDMTMVVTSCDAGDGVRHGLLKKMLDSFIAVNCGGMKPDRCIIIEDGPATLDSPSLAWLKENIHYYSSNVGKVEFISNGVRRGQIYSIDKIYSRVATTYIYHAEEDWVHNIGTDFLRQSKAILDKHPDIIQVSLRGHSGWHTLVNDPKFPGIVIAQPYWRGHWGAMSWNPGLRRLSDYRRIGSYGKYVSYGEAGLSSEAQLSKTLLDMGYRIADLGQRIVEHTGNECSRSNGFKPSQPKVLIASLACFKKSYTRWESEKSPYYDQKTAWEGKPYCLDIHLSGGEDEGISAVRDTWAKDTAKFPNVDVKFFYGKPEEGYPRQPLADEVFLDCGDGYADLPNKTIALCRWVKSQNYDWIVKVDTDTFVFVDKLIHEITGFTADYGGYMSGRVASGGCGYILSRQAFEIIADHATPSEWAEDCMVAKVLHYRGIQGVNLPGHKPGFSDHWFFPNGFTPEKFDGTEVAIHAVQPSIMRAIWKNQN